MAGFNPNPALYNYQPTTGGMLPPPQDFGPGPAWEQAGRGMPPLNAVPPMPAPPGPAWEQTGRGNPSLPIETIQQTGVDAQALDAPQDTGKITDKYSFFDSPGASDSLIAFGASMLKAPDFLTGLADGAMAVNQVAQKYRPYSEQEIEKQRQLAKMKLMADPQYWEDQRKMASNELSVDQKNAYYDQDGNMYFPATQGTQTGWLDTTTNQFVSGGIPGLTRATDSFNPAMNRAEAQVEREAITDAYTSAQSAASNIRTYNDLLSILPEAGVGTSLDARGWALFSKLTGIKTEGNDPKNIALFESQMSQIALNTSRSLLQGQGQVTESERARIDTLVGGRDKLTIEAAKELFAIAKRAEERKVKLFSDWKADANLRSRYNNRFTEYHAAKMAEANLMSPSPPSDTGGANQGSGTSTSSTTGKKSLSDIFRN